ncbi:MAG: SAM-dependent DNA methyltransferase [Promethearchaeota archaeon]|nr:MAG: SAM-dependent DNA methyltransferase [Candidatus Lokiarchaeota archaeon]
MFLKKDKEFLQKRKRRVIGAHLTSSETFLTHIFPEIKTKLNDYLWVDLYAGEGNLILPILKSIPTHKRETFFKKHIFLSDIRKEMVKKSIKKAKSCGISQNLAEKHIIERDNLNQFPHFLKKQELPIYHITNPPYLYLGYIKKHPETKQYFKYFEGKNNGYQDLYQIAMINDLRNRIGNLIYIIPTNFLFGSSVSNKFRLDFLKYYTVEKMYIFEQQMFEFTGTNILIGFFKRKNAPKLNKIVFEGIKFKNEDTILNRKYNLNPDYKYRAGSEFNEFLDQFKARKPLKVSYYLQKSEVEKNKGSYSVNVIDTSEYESNQYNKKIIKVNKSLKEKIFSNRLYIRTVDTGSFEGRVGLNSIWEDFNVDGIYVSGNTYRTSPIQVFLEPRLSKENQELLKQYFDLMLEYFREKLDSEFLTTYKYSKAEYTRKYLGLTQTRSLIKTFPILSIRSKDLVRFQGLIEEKNPQKIITLLGEI